jgi:glucuronoarabinoxylan endo-1,4-beta-xylanase
MIKQLLLAVMTAVSVQTATAVATIRITVNTTKYQRVTGFGAAACYGAMAPIQDTMVIAKLYGPDSPVGLNLLRMEISPNTIGDVTTPWDTPYDWHGYLPVVKAAKKRGAIIFGTPWSPPAIYKTNNTAQGGNSESQGYLKGKLNETGYVKFFNWLNSFCAYMQSNDAAVDIVSIQNEPDWWVSYSGCLYSPTEMHNLVSKYANRLLKNTYHVRLMGGESFYYNPVYTDSLLNFDDTNQYIDLIGGHIYGTKPLGNMKNACATATAKGKETWMTEHSFDPRGEKDGSIVDLPTWHEQLLFAEELNESMLAGISGYVYWYMIAHWSFIGSGDKTIQPGNDYGKVLDRGYVMAHFAKNLPGATRLGQTANVLIGTNSAFQATSYIKGDSMIVMAIDTTKNSFNFEMNLPYQVKSGIQIQSTEGSLYQKQDITITAPTNKVTVPMPARSLSTYIFTIDWDATGIKKPETPVTSPLVDTPVLYNLNGQKISTPRKHGVYLSQHRKIIY